MGEHNWHLDPARFPQRLDLELSDRALDHLERLSARTGRSVRDLAEHLLMQAVAEQQNRIL